MAVVEYVCMVPPLGLKCAFNNCFFLQAVHSIPSILAGLYFFVSFFFFFFVFLQAVHFG